MSDDTPTTEDGTPEPDEASAPAMNPPTVEPLPAPATDAETSPTPTSSGNRPLGLIIGAVVAVVALIIGIVVFTGGDDDETVAGGSTTSAITATTDNGGASNNGGDPNDPCSSVNLSTDLHTDNLDAVSGTCDGTWAVAARDGEPLFIAHLTDGTWLPLVDVATTAVCHDDAIGFQWPAAVVEAVEWPCASFTAPQVGAYVAESPDGETLEVGMQGERVAALQNALSLKGLLAPEEMDGMFGGATREALLVFQAFGGLQISARADLATLHSLGVLPTERASLMPLVTNGIALGDLLIGGNGRRVNEYLTGILGPPDRVSVPSTRVADSACHDPKAIYYTWSGLTVEVAGFDPVTFADTDWKMVYWRYEHTSATLDISSPGGGRVGDTIDEWRSKYSTIEIQELGGTLGLLTVDQGLIGRFDDAGTVVLMYSGQRNCPGAP